MAKKISALLKFGKYTLGIDQHVRIAQFSEYIHAKTHFLVFTRKEIVNLCVNTYLMATTIN